MGLLEDALRAYAKFEDRTTDPATAPAGAGLVYFKDGKLHSIDDAGVVTEYGAGVGGATTTLLHVRDEKATGTSGGAAVTGWNTRTLNTVKTNAISGASLASNLVTLPAGTYEADFSAPSYRCDRHRVRLYDETNAAVLILGQNAYSANADYAVTSARGVGQFTLAASANVRVDHYLANGTGGGTNAFGIADNEGTTVEVYAELLLRKTA